MYENQLDAFDVLNTSCQQILLLCKRIEEIIHTDPHDLQESKSQHSLSKLIYSSQDAFMDTFTFEESKKNEILSFVLDQIQYYSSEFHHRKH